MEAKDLEQFMKGSLPLLAFTSELLGFHPAIYATHRVPLLVATPFPP